MVHERGGFTLIEVLVALTISMVLMGLAWSGFQQLRRMSLRNQANTTAALDSGFVYRRLADDVRSTNPGAQMRVETPVLYTDSTGKDRRIVRLIALRELPEQKPGGDGTRANTYEPTVPLGAVWYCWEFRPPTQAELDSDPKAMGSLWYGRSSASRRDRAVSGIGLPTGASGASTSSTVTFRQMAQPRRSRERSLNDNDFRLIDGSPTFRVRGDRTDLLGDDLSGDGDADSGDGDGLATPGQMQPVLYQVRDLSIGWIDHAGWTTVADASGVTVRKSDGSTVPPPTGKPWWTSEVRVVDGLWRDGSNPAVDAGQSAVQARPALVITAFSIAPAQLDAAFPYTFSIPATLEVPAFDNL